MAPRTYLNFDLVLEGTKSGTFRARVTSSPLGETRTTKFSLPFDQTQLENLLLKLDPGRSGTRRSSADPLSQAAIELGGRLFESVFSDELRLAWTRAQDIAQAEGQGLRLRLRLTDAPAIAGLPWELLYDRRSNSYLAQSDRTPLVRYLEVSQPPRPLLVNGPLRVLVVISSPTNLDELDVDAEWRKLRTAMADRIADGRVQLDRLPSPTMADLAAWLHHNDVHVLHFIGHGDYDPRLEDGVLMFCDAYGRSMPVSASTLGPIIRDHDPLRLVVLNACRSARVDTKDPFSGMAQGLVQQRVTAVVAMQFPISDKAASTFAAHFYRSLCDGNPVDQSVTWARQSLLIDHGGEWATPVLFLRSSDGQVFEHIEPTGAADVVTTAVRRKPAPIDETTALPPDLLVARAAPLTGVGPSGSVVDRTPSTAPHPPEDSAGSGMPAERHHAEQEERRRRRVGVWLIPAVTVLLMIAVFVFINVRSQNDLVSAVPTPTINASPPTAETTTDSPSAPSSNTSVAQPRTFNTVTLIGLGRAEAEGRLQAFGLASARITLRYQANAAAEGTVIAVSPARSITTANAVLLTVSSGPPSKPPTTQPDTSPTTTVTTAPPTSRVPPLTSTTARP